ncbi:facilitated trehalose transporter Tret1-2 homolog [Ostrinia nubilalis]|uniref:facilitated trehalose transporter Tret1-2 homolog n=1 Tax=Ostrinia nubilalis TaxID=29057 RepID=UPI0030822E66
MRREANSTEAVSPEMSSWISSAFGYASIPGVFLLAYLTTRIGRKRTFNLVSINMLVVATSYYLSSTPMHIIITEILQGIPHACSVSTSIIALVEYTSPENRGLMLTIKSATIFWGIWAANTVGTLTNWRYICVLSYMNAAYALSSFFWPESPLWLASKGRFEECKESHRWLKGRGDAAEKELEKIIRTQMENVKKPWSFRNMFLFLTLREFYKPIILSSIMMVMYHLSGKHVFTMYAIDILKKITNSETAAYNGMLILDGVSVFCMYIGCVLSKFLRRRTLLFVFGPLAALFLFLMSLYLYLVKLSIVNENKYVSIMLLIGFSTAIGLGPIILATSLYGELIPANYKGQAVTIISLIFVLIQSTVLKTSPYGFVAIGTHGMFMFYGISVTVCLCVLYKYLPETKDKTLQEIEDHFKRKE